MSNGQGSLIEGNKTLNGITGGGGGGGGSMLPWLGGASMVGSIGQGILGGYQYYKGSSLWDALQNEINSGKYKYTRPEEITQALALAKNAFIGGNKLPGQGEAENKLSSSTSQAIEMARANGMSPDQIMAMISGANYNQNRGLVGIATSAAENQIRNRAAYEHELGVSGEYADKEYEYNVRQPMMAKMQFAQELMGGGMQNIAGGVNGLTSGAISLAKLLA